MPELSTAARAWPLRHAQPALDNTHAHHYHTLCSTLPVMLSGRLHSAREMLANHDGRHPGTEEERHSRLAAHTRGSGPPTIRAHADGKRSVLSGVDGASSSARRCVPAALDAYSGGRIPCGIATVGSWEWG